jgi:YD repeat-containing protein
MLRRNLLKSLTAIIPISFLGKNAIANENEDECNPNYTWEHIIRDEKGQIVKIQRSDGYCSKYERNENGRLLKEKTIMSNNYWREYTYNDKGNVLIFKDSKGSYSTYSYDLNGNLIYPV